MVEAWGEGGGDGEVLRAEGEGVGVEDAGGDARGDGGGAGGVGGDAEGVDEGADEVVGFGGGEVVVLWGGEVLVGSWRKKWGWCWWLTIQVRMKKTSVSRVVPRRMLLIIVAGMAAIRRWRAAASLMRPDGIGRHGLLTASSTADPGWRWLLRSKTNSSIQVDSMTSGSRRRMP